MKNKLLDDVRRDAIRKLLATEEDRHPLAESVNSVINMANIARMEGPLALGYGFLYLFSRPNCHLQWLESPTNRKNARFFAAEIPSK